MGMFPLLAWKAMASKTKSGNERFLIYRSKYMLIMKHIILKWDSPKGFLDFIKNELTCKFCLFCFVFILVKFLLPKRFLVIHSTSFRVAIFHTFFEALLGLSHFKIMCIIINIYFDLWIKRYSYPLLIFEIIVFRADI